ncbi:hypothetical protein Tco_0426264 [Tanacetum coccineum]
MSKSAERAQMPANSIVRNTAGKGSKQATDGPLGFLPEDRLQKVHQEKLQGKEGPEKGGSQVQAPCPEALTTLKARASSPDSGMADQDPPRRRSPTSTTVFTRLGPKIVSRHMHASDKRRASVRRSVEDPSHRRREARNLVRSYVTCSSERQRKIGREWDAADRANRRQAAPTEETYPSESEHGQGGRWKSKSKKRSTYEEDLSQPWLCEETDAFTARIRNFEVPKRTRTPTNVKTYDGTGDLKDHLKIFQTAAKIERWVMPTWCHMFNSTLIGSARQKKYIKDPVEIHHIKQRKGESTEAFMERFKAESMHVNGAPEYMRISGFMHGITNPDLIKHLNDNIPMSVDEMMSMTTTFLRGEVAVANQSRKKTPSIWRHHETSHKPSFDKWLDFKSRQKPNKRHDRFTPLIKTPK